VRGSRPEDRIAVVTGSGHRLGKAIALSLARRGFGIVIHFHQAEDEANKTAEAVSALDVPVWIARADLRTTHGVDELFRMVDETGKYLAVLINAAGVMLPSRLLDVTPEDWKDSIGLNLKGMFFCVQAGARRMASGGAIINISDVAGHEPWPAYPLLSISKAGVEMLTRVAALSLAPGIRVNAIAPGPVLKPEEISADRWEEIGRERALRRTGSADDVTRAVNFILDSEFMTGETVVIDGGWLLGTC